MGDQTWGCGPAFGFAFEEHALNLQTHAADLLTTNTGMDIVWLATAASIFAIAFFARQLLIERTSRKIVFSVSLALFATAIFLPIFMHGDPTLFPSLINPLVSLGLFLLMRKLFVRWKHREPIDTFFDWRSGLAADRWFNIVYFSLGMWLLLLLYVGADLTGWKWH